MSRPNEAKRLVPAPLSVALLGVILWFCGPQGVQAHPNVWTATGPPGGSVTALAIEPRQPKILYAAAWGAGVFKTVHRGERWSRASKGLTSLEVRILAIDPETPATVYAGTKDAGVFKSTDGGDTWKAINVGLSNPYAANVRSLAVDPRNPNTLYAGTGFSAGPGNVFKSTDGGETWNRAGSGLNLNFEILDLAIDPQTPTTVYAVGWGGRWYPSRVYKSIDGGGTWSAASAGLPSGPQLDDSPPILNLAIDPHEPSILYAGTLRRGVFKSTDGGGSWRAASTGLPSGQPFQPYPGIADLAIHPQDTKLLYVSVLPGGVFKSTDGGDNWVPANSGLSNLVIGRLAIDPSDRDRLYVVDTNGVFSSTDGGSSWSHASTGIVNSYIVTLAVDPLHTGIVYAGTASFVPTILGRVFKSTDRAQTWSQSPADLGIYAILSLAIDPQTPTTLYAGAMGANLFKSTDGGDSWTWIEEWNCLFCEVQTIAVDPRNSNTVYLGTGGTGIYKSTDGGASWTAINAGLTPAARNVSTLLIHPQDPMTLYAGSIDGVFKSTDGGASWNSVTAGFPIRYVGSLAIDPQTPTTVYVGTTTNIPYPDRDDGGVHKSTDGGATWTAVNTGLNGTKSRNVNALVIDPRIPSTLYAGTEDGVFRSTDSGASWGALNTGLEGLAVSALDIDPSPPGALYAGTMEGGVFVLTPLPERDTVVEAAGR